MISFIDKLKSKASIKFFLTSSYVNWQRASDVEATFAPPAFLDFQLTRIHVAQQVFILLITNQLAGLLGRDFQNIREKNHQSSF